MAGQSRVPALQIVWLVIYWVAVAQTVFLEYEAVSGGAAPSSIVILTIGLTAAVIGAMFATRLVMKRVSDHWFVKGSTTARVIAVAWVLIGLAINVGSVVSVMAQIDLTGDALTAGIIGTVGSVSLIAILGPGYSEYRDALASTEEGTA